MTPLLQSHGWPAPASASSPEQKQQQRRIIKLTDPASVPPPPPPPPLKTSRSSGLLGKKGAKNMGTGSPVESWEIQTAFAAPPKR
jgi:hypothetical protein